jgi:hypothetical protein
MTCDEDDRDSDAGIGQLTLKLQTVNPRKTHVQNQTAWAVWQLVAQKFLRRCKGCTP